MSTTTLGTNGLYGLLCGSQGMFMYCSWVSMLIATGGDGLNETDASFHLIN